MRLIKTRIRKKSGFLIFKDFDDNLTSHYLCEICHREQLIEGYVYIINTLREYNLLPKDFKAVCCKCKYVKEIIGTNYCKICLGCLIAHTYFNKHEIICLKCGSKFEIKRDH